MSPKQFNNNNRSRLPVASEPQLRLTAFSGEGWGQDHPTLQTRAENPSAPPIQAVSPAVSFRLGSRGNRTERWRSGARSLVGKHLHGACLCHRIPTNAAVGTAQASAGICAVAKRHTTTSHATRQLCGWVSAQLSSAAKWPPERAQGSAPHRVPRGGEGGPPAGLPCPPPREELASCPGAGGNPWGRGGRIAGRESRAAGVGQP